MLFSKESNANISANAIHSVSPAPTGFSSEKEASAPKVENKLFSKKNAISFVKGGAVGLFVAYSWLNIYRLDVPPVVIFSFAAASVAMNYNQAAYDFKEGFQKGVVVGTPVFACMTNAAPAFVSASMLTIGTVWGICRAVNQSVKRKKELK